MPRDNLDGADKEAERLWLKRLKLVVYDIKDLLSSYEANNLEKKEKRLDNMVQNLRIFFSRLNPVISTITTARKIRGTKKRLNKIATELFKYKFIEEATSVCVSGVDSIGQRVIDSRETTSFLNQNHERTIVGREEEKETLVRWLLDDNEEGDFGIIPIVGFGGLGKTTLAQLLFNDERIKRAFDLQAWVYVLINFDLKKIEENLIGSIKGSRGNPGTHKTEEAACTELKQLLDGKRFLIVLDDLWEERGMELEKLKKSLQGGMKNSKVILTTRNHEIATSIGATRPHLIKVLPDEHCRVLFSNIAFESDVQRGNQELVEIGWEIVNKCKGVPVAIKALGYTMRIKDGVDSF